MTALEPEGSGDHTVHLPKLGNEKTAFCVWRKSGGAACPCSIFFDLPAGAKHASLFRSTLLS